MTYTHFVGRYVGRYVGTESPIGFEQERIRLLRELEDPHTIRRLEHIGAGSGWRCLEVAAGDGSIAAWLADRVGSAGHVVATDVDLRLLHGRERTNLQVRQHDILQDPLETACYDLVHCRALLMHLAQPQRALQQMAAALRPGGWLLVEETDYTSFAALDSSHPHVESVDAAACDAAACDSQAFDDIVHTILSALRTRGVLHPYLGGSLPALLEPYNLVHSGQEHTTRVVRGGEAAARYQAMNFCTLVRPYLRGVQALPARNFAILARAFAILPFPL